MKKLLFAIMSVVICAAAFAASSLVSDTTKSDSVGLFGRPGSLKVTSSTKDGAAVQQDNNTGKSRLSFLPMGGIFKPKFFSGKLVSSKPKQEQQDIQKIPGKNGENGNMVQILWDSKTGELKYALVDENGDMSSPEPLDFNRNDFGSIQEYKVNIPRIVCDEKYGMYKSVLDDQSILIEGSKCIGEHGADGRVPELKCDPEISENFIYSADGMWYEIENSKCIGKNGQNARIPTFRCLELYNDNRVLQYKVGNGLWKTVEGATVCNYEKSIEAKVADIECIDNLLVLDGKTQSAIKCQEAISPKCGFYGDGDFARHLECLKKYVASGTNEYIFECRDEQFVNTANNDLVFTGANCDKIYCNGWEWFFADLGQNTGIPCKNVKYYDCDKEKDELVSFPGVKCGETRKIFCDVDGWVYIDDGKSKKNTNVQCDMFGKIYCHWDTGMIFDDKGSTGVSCKYAQQLGCKDGKIPMYGDAEFPFVTPCESVVCGKDGYVMYFGQSTGIPCFYSNGADVGVVKEYTCDKGVLTVGGEKIACGDKMRVICATDGMVYYSETKEGPWNPTGVSCGALEQSDMYCLWDINSIYVKGGGSCGISCDKSNISCKDGEITIKGCTYKVSVDSCDKDLVCDKDMGIWLLRGYATGIRCDLSSKYK